MEVTESQLATAFERFYVTVESGGGDGRGNLLTARGPVADADETAEALFATLSRMAALREPHPRCADAGCSYCNPEPVVDAHICCDHASGDAELAAMAALLPALPLVSKLGYDARERVMDWAKHRACDGQAPF